MRTRRRKFRGTWLPTIGTSAGEGLQNTTGRSVVIDTPVSGLDDALGVVSLVRDSPQEPNNLTLPGHGLGDFLGNEYTIRRIVGKFFASVNPIPVEEPPAPTYSNAFKITMGLFVARADNAGDGINEEPIGWSGTQVIENYSPDNLQTIREPWMWRRSWILTRPVPNIVNYGPIGRDGSFGYPSTTAGYGSVMDGPHVDCKTRRRVSSDDRLWMAISVRNYPFGSGTFDITTQIVCHFDYRVFGALRRARNRGNF